MSVLRLRPNQRGPWCDYCPTKSVRAIWRGYGHARFACDGHRPELEAWDRRQRAPDYSDAAFFGGQS